ncbi:hypothetical protein Tco_0623120 [Tanacetum coccineum]
MEIYGKTCYHGYGVTGLCLRRNTFEAYKLKTFLHNSVSNFPQPILGFGNKVYSSTSDRRKVEEAMYREWLKFNNRDFTLDTQNEFKKRLTEIQIMEIECPEGLDFEEFGRHSGKEKVTLDDLFLLHSMDGGVSVDVPWHVAKFLSDKAKGSKRKSPIVGAHLIGKIASYYALMTLRALMNVTLGLETSSMSVAKLVDLGICRYNGLGIGEMVAEIPEVAGDDDVRAGQADIGGVRRHPNMSNANRLRAMDERLGEIVNNVDELTYVVSRMSKQYDQFYREFGQWRTEQECNTPKLGRSGI